MLLYFFIVVYGYVVRLLYLFRLFFEYAFLRRRTTIKKWSPPSATQKRIQKNIQKVKKWSPPRRHKKTYAKYNQKVRKSSRHQANAQKIIKNNNQTIVEKLSSGEQTTNETKQ